MIEKKIHYIWFGNKKTQEVEECIESWKKHLPDYKIVEWNEKNIDIEKEKRECLFFKECYERKLWAYVADYLRVKILYENGGIYLDTDIEVVKNFDSLLDNNLFLGYENDKFLGGAVMGAVPNQKILKEMLEFYHSDVWKSKMYIITDILTYFVKENYKNQEELVQNRVSLYPPQYFFPYAFDEEFSPECVKEDTYAIHKWSKSWKKNPNTYFLKYKHYPYVIRKIKTLCKLINFYIKKREW